MLTYRVQKSLCDLFKKKRKKKLNVFFIFKKTSKTFILQLIKNKHLDSSNLQEIDYIGVANDCIPYYRVHKTQTLSQIWKQGLTYWRHLRDTGRIRSFQEPGLVIVNVLDLDYELWLGLQRPAGEQVHGLGAQCVERLHLSVQALQGVDVPRRLVDGENGAGSLAGEGVLHYAVALVQVCVKLWGNRGLYECNSQTNQYIQYKVLHLLGRTFSWCNITLNSIHIPVILFHIRNMDFTLDGDLNFNTFLIVFFGVFCFCNFNAKKCIVS